MQRWHKLVAFHRRGFSTDFTAKIIEAQSPFVKVRKDNPWKHLPEKIQTEVVDLLKMLEFEAID